MANNTITIKIDTNSSEVDKLRESFESLKDTLGTLEAMEISFDFLTALMEDASDAEQYVQLLSDSFNDLDMSINNIDGSGLEKLSESAEKADDKLEDVSQEAEKTAKSLSDIDGGGLEDVADDADKADTELSDVSQSAETTSASLSDIDGAGLEDVADGANEANDGLEKTERSAKGANISLMDIAKTAGVFKLVSAGIDMIVSSLDDAISRFDTMNQFPRVMEQLGHSSEASARSINNLSRGIEGLPTRLDDVVSTAQRISIVTGNIEKATSTTIALNNAMIANGTSTGDASRGLEQYIQMLGNGAVDMQSWRSLNETMGVGLRKTAEAFGFAGDAAVNDLYAALRDGVITFDEFNSKLIELNDGVGGFAELAQESSKGVATSWANVRSAVVRNVANMVEAVDELVLAFTGMTIADNLNKLKGVVDSVFSSLIRTMQSVSPAVKLAGTAFSYLGRVIEPLSPVIAGVVAGFVAMKTAMTIGTLVTAVGKSISLLMAQLVATAGTTSLATVGITGLRVALNALMGPIGWVTAGIGVLVGGVTGAISWFNKLPESVNESVKAMDSAISASDTLSDSLDSSADSAEANMKSIDSTAMSINNLLKSTMDLVGAENKSAGTKKMITDNVEELNGAIDGLNLAYDEENDQLNMNTRAIEERIDIMIQEQQVAEMRRREVEIAQEIAEAQELLIENERLLAEAKQEVNDIPWYKNSSEAKDRVAELEESNGALRASMTALGEENILVSGQIEEANERLALAQESMTEVAITSLEQLEGTQKQVAQSMRDAYLQIESAATDMYNKLDIGAMETLASMQENLEHNTMMFEQWQQNVDSLAGKIPTALHDYLLTGNEEAMNLAWELANATPEQLAGFVEAYENAGQGATDAFEGVHDDMLANMPDEIANLITQTESTLMEQVESAFPGVGEEMVGSIMEGMESVEIGELVLPIMEKMAQSMEENQDTFVESGEKIPEYYSQGITENTELVTEATTGMVEDIGTTLDESAEGVQESGAKIPDELATGMDNNAEVVTESADGMLENVETAITEGTEGMNEAGGDIVDGLASGIDENAGTAETSASDLATSVDEAFSSELGIQSPSTVFIGHGSDVIAGLVQGINDSRGQATEVMSALASELTTSFQDEINNMTLDASDVLTGVTDSFRTSFSSIIETVQSSMSSVNSDFSSGTSEMESTVQGSLNTIKNNITGQMNAVTAVYDSAWQRINSNTMSSLNNMRSGIAGLMRSITNTVQGSMNATVAVMNNASNQAYNAGVNMGAGFRNGLSSMRNSIVNTAIGIANAASAAMRRALVVRSPSRVTTEIGEFTGEGLEVGLLNTEKDIQKASKRIAESAVPDLRIPTVDMMASLGIKGGLGSQGSVYNNNAQYTFTANSGGREFTQEEMIRLFKEFKWIMQQEEGRMT